MNHLFGGCIGDVGRPDHRAAGDQVPEMPGLDDAARRRHETQQKTHIDERGVVRDDELARPAELFATDEFVLDETQVADSMDERAHARAKHRARAEHSALAVRGHQSDQRQHHEAEHESHQPEHQEPESGSYQAQPIEVGPFHGWRLLVDTDVGM